MVADSSLFGTNERAAAALGIDVLRAKLFAFAFAAALARTRRDLVGVPAQLDQLSVVHEFHIDHPTQVSHSLVGVGHLLGRLRWSNDGHRRVSNQEILESTWGGVGRWTQLISGIAILLTVLGYQDGVAAEWVKIFRLFKKSKKWGRPYVIRLEDVADLSATADETRVPPRALTIDGLTVTYGAVTAVNNVSYELRPGTVTGLIGPERRRQDIAH